VNRAPVSAESASGFVVLTRTWRAGDNVSVNLPMEADIVYGRETPYPQIRTFPREAWRR